MNRSYHRILRAAQALNPYWVALIEDRCIGENYHILRDFCREHGLSLSDHGGSVTFKGNYYQVFMFAVDAHADIFCEEFGGERMEPSEKGRGRSWSYWGKGTAKPKKR